jgi:hypothetical protein
MEGADPRGRGMSLGMEVVRREDRSIDLAIGDRRRVERGKGFRNEIGPDFLQGRAVERMQGAGNGCPLAVV